MIHVWEQAAKMVLSMTLEEKAALVSGFDCWNTKVVESIGLGSVMLSDGPHGLRKQLLSQDNLGIGGSVPATSFPAQVLSACSFDPDVTFAIGRAIGEECRKEDVAMLLGPGINIKRHPLCGRNFEYVSEDPLLAGKMAAGFINGVQSTGTGACLKHFAANNQERHRMTINALIDERTLHEIYLKAFRIAIKESNPRAVMCSYNKVNGTYASENKYLLTDILRNKWRYIGLTVSDWGAVHDRVKGIDAGLDLEMPGSAGVNDGKIIDAIASGALTEKALDRAVMHIIVYVLMTDKNVSIKYRCNYDEHHEIAVRAAEDSMVLLKNDNNILPILDGSVAVLGEFAVKPRYQGAGSSKVTPINLDNPFEEMKKAGLNVEYAQGYSDKVDNKLIDEAVALARVKDYVVIFAGLTEHYESEGVDRKDMSMPESHVKLIDAVYKVNRNVIVVLMCGAPVDVSWIKNVKAVLLAYLGGEGVGEAIADIISGKVSPSGKLAETWPLSLKDVASNENFPGDMKNVAYKETIYVGYRDYITNNKPVRFNFTHGLSYTKFAYGSGKNTIGAMYGDILNLSFYVKNIGNVKARETSFIFMECEDSKVYMPKYTLVGFSKNGYNPGQEKLITIQVDTKDFGYYHTGLKDFYAPSGVYNLYCGPSIDKLVPLAQVNLISPEVAEPVRSPDDFEKLIGKELPKPVNKIKRPFTIENCLDDTRHTLIGKMMIRLIREATGNSAEREDGQDLMMDASLMEMPFFALMMSSAGQISERAMYGIVDILNLHFVRGLHKILWNGKFKRWKDNEDDK